MGYSAPTDVDYLIVGGGIAGLTLCRFLKSHAVVCLEPRPCRFKLGEAVSPDHFDHPELYDVAARARRLPSFAEKWGSIIAFDDSTAMYPVSGHGAELAMHIRRDELEAMLIDLWRPPLREERAIEIDVERKLVRSDRGLYRVHGQILDCSGPKMMVARTLGQVRRLWDVFSSWFYLDVEAVDEDGFERWLRATQRDLRIYDAKSGHDLTRADVQRWRPSHYTFLRNVRDGSWLWQIPLYGRREISFGMTSVHGKVSEEALREAVAEHLAPMFRARVKRLDGSTPHHQFHVRNHFALHAETAATMDYVLLGDAFYFGDPIYGTGTASACGDAIDVATALNSGGWTEAVCAAYNARKAELVRRAVAAHYFSPHNQACDVEQQAAPVDGPPQLKIHTFNYASVIAQSKVSLDTNRERGSMFESPYRSDPRALLARVVNRLRLGADRSIAGWKLHSASHHPAGGLELQLRRPGKPVLCVLLKRFDGHKNYYRRFGAVTLSYMNAFDRPYPLDADVEILFEALGATFAAAGPLPETQTGRSLGAGRPARRSM